MMGPFSDFPESRLAKARVNFSTSGGVSPSPGFPPRVPRIPDMDWMSATPQKFRIANIGLSHHPPGPRYLGAGRVAGQRVILTFVSKHGQLAEKQWFETWFGSPYYEVLYLHRNDHEAKGFVDHLVEYLHCPPGATLLDVASGSGRHAREFALHGLEVTGIDLSSRNVQHSRPRESEMLSFYLHDMRRYFRIHYFDYVVNIFTSFGYFETQRDNELALRTMAKALKPEGTLVLDFLNTGFVSSHLVENEVKVIRGVQFVIHRKLEEGRFIKKIEVYDASKLVKEKFEERVIAYSLRDFETLFGQEKLRITGTFGDYDLRPFDEANSPRLILVANPMP